jgi:hypothetical protein
VNSPFIRCKHRIPRAGAQSVGIGINPQSADFSNHNGLFLRLPEKTHDRIGILGGCDDDQANPEIKRPSHVVFGNGATILDQLKD